MQTTMTKISTAAAYATLACTSLDRSRRFYRDALGFDTEDLPDPPGGVMVHCGAGTGLSLYERPTAPNCDTTLCTFIVEDIEAAMSDLRDHGVKFEEYDLAWLKTVNGISTAGTTKASWFKDPDGNILSLVQM